MSKSADAFRTISEVAEWLDTPAHVLRFWESKFSQVKPVKRAGGRRYYRPQDMMLLGGIKKLLHDDGMTIKHVQKLLRQEGVKHVAALSAHPSDGVGYSLAQSDPAPAATSETASVVSFETTPAADTASTADATEETSEGTLPFPSFLSGGSDMPDPEPTAAPQEPVDDAQDAASEMAEEPSNLQAEAETLDQTDDQAGDLFEEPQPDIQPDIQADTQPDTQPDTATETQAEEVSRSEPEADPQIEPVPHIDILSMLAGRSVAEIRAQEAELRPIMEQIRTQLARMS